MGAAQAGSWAPIGIFAPLKSDNATIRGLINPSVDSVDLSTGNNVTNRD